MLGFHGKATIRVHFRNRGEYDKFRKYVLKTEWHYDLDFPVFEEMPVEFSKSDDIPGIVAKIISLLQMGFEVYCCRFQLDEVASETTPFIETVEGGMTQYDDVVDKTGCWGSCDDVCNKHAESDI